MRSFAAIIVALLAAPAAQAETRTAPCSYWSLAGASFEGACKVVSSIDAAGLYVETVTAGETTLVLAAGAHQGVWALYTINGQPGVRFEHNRESFSYSTLALDMTLDIGVQD